MYSNQGRIQILEKGGAWTKILLINIHMFLDSVKKTDKEKKETRKSITKKFDYYTLIIR